MTSNLTGHIFFLLMVSFGCFLATEATPIGKEYLLRRDVTRFFAPRNEVVDSPSPYKCVHIASDLPSCNFESAGDSGSEDSIDKLTKKHHTTSFTRENLHKEKRNTEIREEKGDIIVFSLQGCRPHRLPFYLPTCKDSDMIGKHVEIQKLYPFQVKGVTRPVYEFPEFDIEEWSRAMKQLRDNQKINGLRHQ